MRYATLCTGIGGFDIGFDRAGMECVYQCEVDKTCQSILHRHYPDVPKGMDVNDETVSSELIRLRPDLIAFGFPCQDLSVAGRRTGLGGERSGLFYRCMSLVAGCRPAWLVIENVPGLLSSNGGRDMGAVIGTLVELGYRWAYRVLDSQYDGVAQRRERVFIVGHLGTRPHPAEILFDSESMPWNPAPRREAGTGATHAIASCIGASGRGFSRAGETRGQDPVVAVFGGNNTSGPIDVATACNAKGGSGRMDVESETFVAHTLRAEGFDASEDGTGRGTPIVPVAFDTTQITSPSNYSNPKPGDPCHPLAVGQHAPAIAYQCHGTNVGPMGAIRQGNGHATGGVPFVFESKKSGEGGEVAPTLRSMGHDMSHANAGGQLAVQSGMAVRRLTPRECERLQSFPDDFTRYRHDGSEIADGPRYRMLGNAVTVNVAFWIGQQIIRSMER